MLKTLVIFLALVSAFLFAAPPSNASQEVAPIVDLHAHIFFYEGMGTSLLGGFNSQKLSHDWTDIFEPRVNAKALNDSGVRIAVIALYAHPLFLVSEKTPFEDKSMPPKPL